MSKITRFCWEILLILRHYFDFLISVQFFLYVLKILDEFVLLVGNPVQSSSSLSGSHTGGCISEVPLCPALGGPHTTATDSQIESAPQTSW